jgi:uncharacterized protein YggE
MESIDYKKYTWIAGTFALAGIFFASLATGASEWKSMKHPTGQVASITVTGEGEVTAVPDIATVTMTIHETGKTVPEAQKLAEAKVKAGIAALSSYDVTDKDTKTISYTVYPKYENVLVSYGATSMGYPQTTNQKIVGYEVSETIEVTVHKIDQAGEILGALGAANITEISGPSFTVEDMDKVQADAKEKAIANAKEKAKATAKALGVDLGEITQFNENSGGYYPMFLKAEVANQSGAADARVTLPQGENVIKSQVTITYTLD